MTNYRGEGNVISPDSQIGAKNGVAVTIQTTDLAKKSVTPTATGSAPLFSYHF